MNVKRYFARTAREAMSQVRAELGEDAIVLKNRPVDGGVEILALADSELSADEPVEAAPPRGAMAGRGGERVAPGAGAGAARVPGMGDAGRAPMPGNVERAPAMSTVHFENYVRERQQRRLAAKREERGDERAGNAAAGGAGSSKAAAGGEGFDDDESAQGGSTRGGSVQGGSVRGGSVQGGSAQGGSVQGGSVHDGAAQGGSTHDERRPTRFEAPAVHVSEGFVRDAQSSDDRLDVRMLMNELREMRGALSDQLESMSWFEGVRRRPGQSRMLRRLLQAGFSPSLSRTLANHLPADFGEEDAERWLREALVRNLRIDSPERTIFDAGGTYALLGPTGVGKTTTAAKIAAQFALKHGAQSVGLITADVYRIGAQDQLRTFGRLLGVPVHVAHDVSTLADFLQMYMNRKLVLIDTAGVAQRDERVGELLAALSSAQVRKVLVVNAASQAEAIDETVEAYQGRNAAGVVLSKVDEAVRLGGALDCLIRHRLTLQGVANGQRVPEDWHRPEPRMLVDRALATETSRASASFSFEEAELAMLLAAGQRTAAQRAREAQRV